MRKQILCVLICLFLAGFLQSKDILQKIRVIKKNSIVYSKPDKSSNTLFVLKYNSVCSAKKVNQQWYRITKKKITGYLSAEHALPFSEIKDKPSAKTKKKDKIFLMGIGMLRLNWAKVKGDSIRFRYSDLGLPADLSTRERASFMVDGTFADQKYKINGHLNYDPENRVTEPPLEFLITAGNENINLSVGDYRRGVMEDTVYLRYLHPFRGAFFNLKSSKAGFSFLAGLARGESGVDEISADTGAGPYYIKDSPVLRGSESVWLVTRSRQNPDYEVRRVQLTRNRDYYFDYDRGSLVFTDPLFASDELGNPVYIVVNYQYESMAGRFSRGVWGFSSFYKPFEQLKLSFSYIGDGDKNLSVRDMLKESRNIYAFGLNLNNDLINISSEFAFSSEESSDSQTAYFGSGILNLFKNFKINFNAWKIDADFPVFANKQLQYGFTLSQVLYTETSNAVFLSPFQFSRNLMTELYPFTLARISVGEREFHSYGEWEQGDLKVSAGFGRQRTDYEAADRDTIYISSLYNTESSKMWLKAGLGTGRSSDKSVDQDSKDIMAGVRQRVKKFSSGDLFVQADFQKNWFDDFTDLRNDVTGEILSFSTEYLKGRHGVFAGFRQEKAFNRTEDIRESEKDIFEFGIKHDLFKGVFVDSRYRNEKIKNSGEKSDVELLSLGAGFESKKFRALLRYETQINSSDETEGKRKLWSVYLFGSPLKRMSVSLRYYKREGSTKDISAFTESGEEQLNFRLVWRPDSNINVYSQWRYDTNLELVPAADQIESNSLAFVQGIKIKFSKKFEFLANYKMIKIWGPVDNRKYSAAAELGYLLFSHLRTGLGFEIIDYKDKSNPDSEYKTYVGYFKIVVLY